MILEVTLVIVMSLLLLKRKTDLYLLSVMIFHRAALDLRDSNPPLARLAPPLLRMPPLQSNCYVGTRLSSILSHATCIHRQLGSAPPPALSSLNLADGSTSQWLLLLPDIPHVMRERRLQPGTALDQEWTQVSV